MLARVAENLYWLARYLERAENQARLIDVRRLAGAERSIFNGGDPWELVIDTLGAAESITEAREENPELTAEEFLVYSVSSPYSIRTTVTSARKLALELREHTSREVFEAINGLYLSITVLNQENSSIGATMQRIRNSVATVFGLFENTVIHSEGAHWFRIGQLLERADMTSRIVDAKYFINLPSVNEVGGAIDKHQWRWVLRSASAVEGYHRAYLGSIRVERVIDMLFLNSEFPRSLLYCIDVIRSEFEQATHKAPPMRTLEPSRDLAVVQLELRALTGAEIVLQGLHDFIDRFQATLIRIDEGLANNLFRALPADNEANRKAPLGHAISLQSN